jgi:ribosomal protein S18 acetylase RimI-like enzyme
MTLPTGCCSTKFFPWRAPWLGSLASDEKMIEHQFRNFSYNDVAQVMDLQLAYARSYPNALVIPGEAYLSPGFHGGEDVLCLFDLNGQLLGYAPLFTNLILEANDTPHTVWAEVKVNPGCESPTLLKDLLFEKAVSRAREITREAPEHKTRMIFQYDVTETQSIAYVQSKGSRYAESVFQMRRLLAQEIPLIPQPTGVTVRQWRMDTDAEQREYIRARNEAFPEAPIALEEWQYFLQSPNWEVGNMITAFDGTQVVGSVAVYWDEEENRRFGRKAGHTEYIFVCQGWRKQGIAAYIICEALKYLRDRQLEEAVLEVRALNRKALSLYESLGYQVINESQLFVLELD